MYLARTAGGFGCAHKLRQGDIASLLKVQNNTECERKTIEYNQRKRTWKQFGQTRQPFPIYVFGQPGTNRICNRI